MRAETGEKGRQIIGRGMKVKRGGHQQWPAGPSRGGIRVAGRWDRVTIIRSLPAWWRVEAVRVQLNIGAKEETALKEDISWRKPDVVQSPWWWHGGRRGRPFCWYWGRAQSTERSQQPPSWRQLTLEDCWVSYLEGHNKLPYPGGVTSCWDAIFKDVVFLSSFLKLGRTLHGIYSEMHGIPLWHGAYVILSIYGADPITEVKLFSILHWTISCRLVFKHLLFITMLFLIGQPF